MRPQTQTLLSSKTPTENLPALIAVTTLPILTSVGYNTNFFLISLDIWPKLLSPEPYALPSLKNSEKFYPAEISPTLSILTTSGTDEFLLVPIPNWP